MEQLDYNLLFRWFTGLGIDDPVWDVTVFTKNRDRLLRGDIAARFFHAVLGQREVKALLSDEHFTVDGTLIEAWASIKSFKPKGGSGDGPPAGGGGRHGERDFHGERRTNQTHASTTDPDARLIRRGRGKEAKLCHMGHLLMENQSGLLVDAQLTTATGTAERAAAEAMLAGQMGRLGPPSAPTRAMMPRTSSLPSVPSTSRRTSPRTAHAAPRSTAGPHAIPATRSANGPASGSRKRSAGSRPRAASARPGTAAPPGSAGCSPSPPRPAT